MTSLEHEPRLPLPPSSGNLSVSIYDEDFEPNNSVQLFHDRGVAQRQRPLLSEPDDFDALILTPCDEAAENTNLSMCIYIHNLVCVSL